MNQTKPCVKVCADCLEQKVPNIPIPALTLEDKPIIIVATCQLCGRNTSVCLVEPNAADLLFCSNN